MGIAAVISYLDTNVVIFLHAGEVDRISHRAQSRMNASDLVVSPMVLLELEMLFEKHRINFRAGEILADLSQQIGLSVCQLPFAHIVHSALAIGWTRDPGDRLIVANAAANNEAPLISKDESIRAHYRNTIW